MGHLPPYDHLHSPETGPAHGNITLLKPGEIVLATAYSLLATTSGATNPALLESPISPRSPTMSALRSGNRPVGVSTFTDSTPPTPTPVASWFPAPRSSKVTASTASSLPDRRVSTVVS